MSTTRVPGRYTRCRVGVARRDVTPPVGIYHRSWGAASHETAEGVHRPLLATAAVIAPVEGERPLLALVAVDHGWFQNADDETALRRTIRERAGLEDSALLINMSHTHVGANANSLLADRPGGELIAPFLARLADGIAEAVAEARERLAPAWIAWGQGRCNLAANRDYWDEAQRRWACGYNPDREADDTLLVGRVTGDDGAIGAILVNYACHPTTLAWANRQLSPDFIGGVRDILERDFGAPVLFLQGASGELGPREGYVGETAVADRNGRQLGYAAASALEALPPPGTTFVYTGVVESGASLGSWAYRPATAEELRASDAIAAREEIVELRRKEALEPVSPEARQVPGAERAEAEKALRRQMLMRALGDSATYRMPLWFWRLGQAALVAIPNEAYSTVQTTLRERFAGTPLLVLGTTNRTLGYLPPSDSYGKGVYQEQQSPFAPGCLEQTIEVATRGLQAVLRAG